METSNIANSEFGRGSALAHVATRLAELPDCTLTEAATDIEVATLDTGISGASLLRLRRATDPVACAQTVLETMREGSVGASDEETALRVRMREAVDLLARKAAALHYTRAGLHNPFVAEPDQHAGRSHHV